MEELVPSAEICRVIVNLGKVRSFLEGDLAEAVEISAAQLTAILTLMDVREQELANARILLAEQAAKLAANRRNLH